MKKVITLLSLVLALGLYHTPAQASFRDKLKGLLGTSGPATVAERIEALSNIESSISKLSQVNRNFSDAVKQANESKAKIYDTNKKRILDLKTSIKGKVEHIQEIAQSELKRLKIEETNTKNTAVELDNSKHLWSGLNAAAGLMASPDSNFGKVMIYAEHMTAGSKTDIEDQKNAIELQKKSIDNSIKDLKIVIDNPSMYKMTSLPKVNEAYNDLLALKKALESYENLMKDVLTIPEQALKTMNNNMGALIKTEQDNINTLLAVARCPGITTWTKAIDVGSFGSYSASKALGKCKYDLELEQKKTAK